MTNQKFSEIETLHLTKKIRFKVIEMTHNSGAAHLGSALSCIDILAALYWHTMDIDPKNPEDSDRDRFILSKGHAAAALYSVLAYRGFFDLKLLETFSKDGSKLSEHPGLKCVPGVEASTGSLGHGLGMGVGMALAAKILKKKHFVYVVISDGECDEGSTWESALFAPAKKLDNLVVILDYNKWQATGRSNEVMSLSPLLKKWESFGWNTYEANGNDLHEMIEKLSMIKSKTSNGKPSIIIANTIKGAGISFMEDDNNWHYRVPNAEELAKAKKELGLEDDTD